MNHDKNLVAIRKEINHLYDKIRELRKQEAKIVEKKRAEMSLSFLERSEKSKNIMKEKIEILGLSAGAENSLKKAGIEIIMDLLSKTESNLLKIKGFGYNYLYELRGILFETNLSIGMHINR